MRQGFLTPVGLSDSTRFLYLKKVRWRFIVGRGRVFEIIRITPRLLANPPLRDICDLLLGEGGFSRLFVLCRDCWRTRPYETLLNSRTFADNHSARNLSIANSLNLASTSIQGAS